MCDPSTLNQEQTNLLDSMKAMIEAESVQMQPDHDLCRYLVGYKWKVDKAFAAYRAERQWYASFRPDLITAMDVKSEIENGKVFYLERNATDLNGNLLVFINANLHNKHTSTKDQLLHAILWMIEDAIRRFSRPTQRLGLVVNMKHLKWGDFYDKKTFQDLSKILNDYYCERLGVCYIVSPPGLFKFGWSIVKGFIDPSTREKIHLTSRKGLSKYIDPNLLPKDLKGNHENFNKDKWAKEVGLLPSTGEIDTGTPKVQLITEDTSITASPVQ